MPLRRVNFAVHAGLLVLCAACGSARPAPAPPPGQWTSVLGGPARTAYVDERLPDSLAVAWRIDVDRGLAAALQIHDGLLLATTTNRAVIALDAESGESYWTRRFSGPIAGTVLRRNDTLFVATGDRDNRVRALDIRRGRDLWERQTGNVRVEPFLLDSLLLVATESGELLALRAANGSLVWRAPLGAAPAVAPVAAEGALFVATARDTLIRFDPATGTRSARVPLPATPSAPILVQPDRLVLALHSGQVLAVGLDAEPLVLWQTSLGAPVLAPLATGPGGRPVMLDRNARVWSVDGAGNATLLADLGGAASGSFTRAGDRFVAGRLDGTLFLLDARGAIIWNDDLGDSIVAPVAAGRGVLFVPLLRGTVVRMQ